MKFETGQTSEPTSANISIVSRSSKRGPTMLRSFAQHIQQCCAGARALHATYTNEINMASEMENVNEELIEELTLTKGRKKAASDGKDRGRARRYAEPEINQLIDLLEEKDCLCPFSLRRLIHCLVLPRRAF